MASSSEWVEQQSSLLRVEDPLYRHALGEAKIILSIWIVALLVTCTYCYLYGYASHPSQPSAWGPTINQWVGPLKSFDRDPASLTTPWGLGIPKWVLVGIVIPWSFCILATIWFCLFVFHDDDLGDINLEEGDDLVKNDLVNKIKEKDSTDETSTRNVQQGGGTLHD
ncbi:MAG: hypothetical protein ABGX16_22125 [Pirellulales bacterium]